MRGQPEDVAAVQRAGYAPHPTDRLDEVDHIHDVREALAVGRGGATLRLVAERTGLRTLLRVPLLKDGRVLGRIVSGRREVRPFDAKHIALLRTFADQAVLAIENARLVDDLRARTAELAQRNDAYGEQVVHQSATIDVLKTMSASPADPQPVFALIAERAREICEGDSVTVFQYDGSMVHLRHIEDPSTGDDASARGIRGAYPMAPSRATTSGLAILDRRIVHMPDMQAEPDLLPALRARGHRSHLAVPLLRGETPVGAIMLNARRPGGFSDRQVELMKTFAEQAVIAIDSAETYRALEQRTADLQEALDYQTATSDVLKSIGRSTFDLQGVLDTLLASAAELCRADNASIAMREGDALRVTAHFTRDGQAATGSPPGSLLPMTRGTILGRAAVAGAVVHVHDVAADLEFSHPRGLQPRSSALGVPLIRDGEVIGVMRLAREQVEPFTDRQIELVKAFADQAVIATENAQLVRRAPRRARPRRSRARRPAPHPGPAGADREARLARPAHRRHRARDQEPAELRQQLRGGLGRPVGRPR